MCLNIVSDLRAQARGLRSVVASVNLGASPIPRKYLLVPASGGIRERRLDLHRGAGRLRASAAEESVYSVP